MSNDPIVRRFLVTLTGDCHTWASDLKVALTSQGIYYQHPDNVRIEEVPSTEAASQICAERTAPSDTGRPPVQPCGHEWHYASKDGCRKCATQGDRRAAAMLGAAQALQDPNREGQCSGPIGVLTVLLSDVKRLPARERIALRNYLAGGGKKNGYIEARYRDEPVVRRIFGDFSIKVIS